MKNEQGDTPLDISIEHDSLRTTDLMLRFLSHVKNGDYSRQLYEKFPDILKLGLKSFHRYLETCMFHTSQMLNAKYFSMKSKEDVVLVVTSSCIIDRKFMEKHTTQGSAEKKLRERRIALANQEKAIEEEHKRKNEGKKKAVDRKTRGEEESKNSPIETKQILLEDNEESKHKMYDNDDGDMGEQQNTINDGMDEEAQNLMRNKLQEEQDRMGGVKTEQNQEEKKRQEEIDKKKKDVLEAAQKQLEEDLKKQKEARKQGLSRYDIKAIEFDWLFDDNYGKKFLVALATTDDIELFSLDIIQKIVMFLWKFYRRAIFFQVLIPFIVYFITFILYATWINEEKFDEDSKESPYWIANIAMIIFLLIIIVYQAMIETRQILYYRLEYFKSFWNLVDVCSLILNTVVIICDAAGMNERNVVPMLAIGVLLMWLKLIYFGRMFLSTAWMVRMIYSVTSELGNFIIIFAIMVVGFANTFIIVARVSDPIFTGEGGFWDAIKYTYRTGLGDFNTENIPKDGFNVLIYCIWILCTFLILIVLLNMIIAIISDIFEKVYESMSSNLLKELVVLMVESELLISRKSLFKNYRYIFIITKETGDIGRGDVENKLDILKHCLDTQVEDHKEKVDELRDNIGRFLNEKLQEKSETLDSITNARITSVTTKFDELDIQLKEYTDAYEHIVYGEQIYD